IMKPLDGMGGASIFRVKEGDPNIGVIAETLTELGNRYCMAQKLDFAICFSTANPSSRRPLANNSCASAFCRALLPGLTALIFCS
ncbi:hypothetical protein MJO10_31540, partial [Salmonella enterica subsp. enterica serovar Anatum]|nr:hypothetical protein [Salmonella enterica subsp. enterica serovar Anatum]